MLKTRDHFPIHKTAGDGYHEPREAWVKCSCGAHIWDWQEYYNENPDSPDECFQEHLDAMEADQ